MILRHPAQAPGRSLTRDSRRSVSRRRLWLLLSALAIVAADSAFHIFSPPLVLAGALDEPAHAATTVIFLGALGWPRTRTFGIAALVASLALDVDHIPQYLGTHVLTAGTPRPYPHSLLTLLAVGLVAAAGRGRMRWIALGVELGLVGHMFRDMAEPSSRAGIALFWPVSDANLRVPYALYAGVMAVLLAIGIWRSGHSPGGPAGGDRPEEPRQCQDAPVSRLLADRIPARS